jgi:peroxiredoxin
MRTVLFRRGLHTNTMWPFKAFTPWIAKQGTHMTTLASALEEFSASLRDKAPRVVLEAINSFVADLAQSGIAGGWLQRGDRAPDFALHDATGGGLVESRDLRQRGPLVLCFYRGAWCPYCNLELRAWQQHLAELTDLGASFTAISPQTPDASQTLADKHALSYPVLADRGNAVARRFGLVFTVGEGMRGVLEGFGVHLPAYNGESTFELPVPATYLVAGDATIVGAWVDVDYRRRPEPAAVLARVRDLVGPSRHDEAARATARSTPR